MMMLERGLTVDHSTVYRWVQAYARNWTTMQTILETNQRLMAGGFDSLLNHGSPYIGNQPTTYGVKVELSV